MWHSYFKLAEIPSRIKTKLRYLHDDTLAGTVDSESTNLNAVLVLDGLHKRGFTDDLDKLFASVSVLVDLKDISRGHSLVQGDIDGHVNAAEPGGD